MKRSTAPIVRWLASLNLIALLLAAVFGSANTAQAVNRNWLGNTDANFNTAANWSGAIAGQTAVFNAAGSSGTTLNNDIVGLTLAGMTFSATAPAYTITNQSITLGGNIVAQTTAAAQIINLPMTLSANRTVTTTATGLITLGGIISDGGSGFGLTHGGSAGTLTLSGANTFTGPVVLPSGSGTLSVSADNNLGLGSYITNNQNTVLATTASFSTSKSLIFAASGVNQDINVASGTTLTLNGAIGSGGASTWRKAGTGTLVINAASTSTANCTATAGLLRISGSGTFNSGTANLGFNSANGDLGGTSQSVGTLSFVGSSSTLSNGTITATTAFTVNNASGNVNVSAVLAGSGIALTQIGAGRVTLSATNTYTGATSISAGLLGGNGSINGPVTINSGGTLSPGANANLIGILTISNTLTFAAGSTNLVEVDQANGTNDSVAGLTAITYGGTLTVNNLGGTFVGGETYKLFSMGDTSSDFAATNLPPLTGGLEWAWDRTNATITVVSTAARALAWTGSGGASSNLWDVNTTTNWIITTAGNAADVYLDTDPVTFNDIGATNPTVDITGTVLPASVFINSSSNYTFLGSGKISGNTYLMKNGTGTLTLATTNDYTGPTTVNGGTLAISGSLTNPAGALSVNGGKLNVSGSVNIGTGSLQAGSIATNGVINITSGATVTATNASIGATIANGNGALNVSGGSVALIGNTTTTIGGSSGYGALDLSGGTVSGYFIQLGNAATGTGVAMVSGGTLAPTDYLIVGRNSTGVLTVGPGGIVNHANPTHAITVGHATGARGELNLVGGTIDNTGAALTYGEGNGTTTIGIVNLNAGTLTTSNILNPDGTNLLNFSGGTLKAAFSRNPWIPSTLPVYVNGAFGSFAGGAVIDTAGFDDTIAASLLAPVGNGVTSVSVVGTQGSGYIGAPYVSISGDGTGATAYANMVDDGTGNGTLKVGSVTISNPGNGYTGATVSFVGGAPTSAATGTASTGANTSGGLTKNGLGTLYMNGANTYTNTTTINAGTLGGSGSFASPVVIGSSATLSPGASIGTLTINNTLTLATGSTTVMELDKANNLNDAVTGLSAITYGGTLTVNNLGGTFVGGETYQLFSATTYNPGNFTATNLPSLVPGLSWVWTPATGTLSVSGTPTPTNIVFSVSGPNLSLTWPGSYLGWTAQSNAVDIANASDWHNIPGSGTVTNLDITIDPAQPKVFYRLKLP